MAGSTPARSTPARRSYHGMASSPLSDILYSPRNTEERHQKILEASIREQERVRGEARKVLANHLKEEEERLLQEQLKLEEERIRRDRKLAASRLELEKLKAQKIEMPPAPQPQPSRAPTTTTQAVPAPSSNPAPPVSSVSATSSPFAKVGKQQPVSNGTITQNAAPASPIVLQQQTSLPFAPAATASAPPTTKNNPFAAVATHAASTPPTTSPFAQVRPTQQANGAATAPAPTSAATGANQAPPDELQKIHQRLKELRRSMLEQAKQNPALKQRMGDMRREIRKCVGQLTSGSQANKGQMKAIIDVLAEAMSNGAGSRMVSPSALVLGSRESKEDAQHNGDLPSLFLYLLNIFGKAIISQFVNEASARPETADPVGVTAVFVFAEQRFLWRGKSLIDILLAKFRVVCPVVFGYNGNEKYEEGRKRLGWHKEGGSWVAEQQHFDRMTGLGAGFAAISLRNFGKSAKINPFPPPYYWAAMARIVNTPPAEVSNTQAIVLKAMIQHYEGKFLNAYGSTALAALRLALIDFPAKVPEANKRPAIASLQVLAQSLKKDVGLSLT